MAPIDSDGERGRGVQGGVGPDGWRPFRASQSVAGKIAGRFGSRTASPLRGGAIDPHPDQSLPHEVTQIEDE